VLVSKTFQKTNVSLHQQATHLHREGTMQQQRDILEFAVRERVALHSQYEVLSNQMLRIMLAARDVIVPLDRLPRRDLIELAIATHSLVGDSAGILLAVEKLKSRRLHRKAGPLMVDAPL
jgi:hypothetical protein